MNQICPIDRLMIKRKMWVMWRTFLCELASYELPGDTHSGSNEIYWLTHEVY